MIQDIQEGLFNTKKEEIQKEIFRKVIEKYKKKEAFYIPGNVPSSKNSKEIIQMPSKSCICGGTIIKSRSGIFCNRCKNPKRKKYPKLVDSKVTRLYKKNRNIEYKKIKASFTKYVKNLEKPINLGFYLIRDSKRNFDLINTLQVVQDLMVEAGCLEDDNAYIIKPYFLGGHIDKQKSGIFIIILHNYFEKVFYDI